MIRRCCLCLFVVPGLLSSGRILINNDIIIICHAFTTRVTTAVSNQRSTQSQHIVVRTVAHEGAFFSSTELASSSSISGISNAHTNENNENTELISSNTHHPTLVPSTLNEALRVFFGSPLYHGPRLIVLFLTILIHEKMQLGYIVDSVTNLPIWLPSSSLLLNGLEELGVAGMAVVFWWIQEHVMHQRLLHSPHMNWMGKEIHVKHHNQPYYHISIDSAPIMIGWLTVVHVLLRCGLSSVLPLHLIYTATIAYGAAGLFYEWTHFIVHTKVRFSSQSFWTKVKNHHARHHLVNHDNYFAFTITQIDDLFGTNPDVTKVPRLKKLE